MLRRADLHAGLRFVGAMADVPVGVEAFAEAAVAELARFVPSELTTLSVCDLATARRHVVGQPVGGLDAADRAAFDRHFHEHPLVLFHGVRGGTGAHRISDSIPFARFRETSLHAEYYRRIGIDHAVALPIRVGGGTLVSFVLNRRRIDFSDREREWLDLVGPYLARLHRRASATATAREPTRLPAIPAPVPVGEPLTAREREVLEWAGAGKTDRDIALLLGCSHRTVQKHLEHVYRKLGVETRTAAVMRARVGTSSV